LSQPEQLSFERRWHEFNQLDRLREHWYWRPGWRPGRSFYTWHLTFDGQTDLHDLVRRVQSDLDLPGLDLVPVTGLHLTMQGLGFSDETDPADLDAIVSAVREQCTTIAPFPLQMGPVDPDSEGIGLLVSPWEPVIQLRDAVRDTIGTIWQTVPENPDGSRPHVTVAYSGSDAPTEDIRTRLAELRDLPPVPVTIGQVQLIELNRDHREYRWSVVATVGLADAR
jgi:2'-5' RNA ligase